MYVLMTERVYKVANHSQIDKYAPKQINRVDWKIAGPFESKNVATRAMLSALGTHTCLNAEVWSKEYVESQNERWGYLTEDVRQRLQYAAKLMGFKLV